MVVNTPFNGDLMGFNHYKWWFDGELPSGYD